MASRDFGIALGQPVIREMSLLAGYGAFTTCLQAAGNAASVGPVRGPGGFSGGFGCSTPAVNQ